MQKGIGKGRENERAVPHLHDKYKCCLHLEPNTQRSICTACYCVNSKTSIPKDTAYWERTHLLGRQDNALELLQLELCLMGICEGCLYCNMNALEQEYSSCY